MFLTKMKSMDEPLVKLIEQHVIPELDSEIPHLRERAMMVLSKYNRLGFSDEALVHIAKKLFENMTHHDMPI